MPKCASTVLIVGGGIAGLSSAIALTRVGVHCDVVERGNPKEGASIAFSGRAAEALDELGIYDLVYRAGHPFAHVSDAVSVRDAAGNLVSAGPPRPQWANAKGAVGIYRPALIEIMIKVATELGVNIRPGTTVSRFENNTDHVHAVFSGGEEQRYDFMVGADGIESTTRMELFPDHPTPTYAGQLSVRWMAPGLAIEPECWYTSPVGRLGFYSLPEGTIYVPAVFDIPEQKRFSNREVHDLFASLLDSMTAPAIVELRRRLSTDAELIARLFRWILLPEPWYRGRIILVGDAAHATTAHLGQGGGMALEDSVVLAQCVRDEPSGDVGKAFEAFMSRRFDRVSTIVHTSVKVSELERQGASPEERRMLMGKAFAAISSPY